MLLSSVTSLRRLCSLSTIFILITLLYVYGRAPRVEPTSLHIPGQGGFKDVKKWPVDDRRVETVKEDGFGLFGRTAKLSYDQIQERIQDLRKDWTPPNPQPHHWPPYQWYSGENYDPNRWEGFEWENGYYVNNGIMPLAEDMDPKPYHPYPEYNSPAWKSEWIGDYVACEGPRGKLLNESDEDIVHAYPALPLHFPGPVVGDAEVVGIDTSQCFDRYGRLGPYGHGQGDRSHLSRWNRPIDGPDWTQIRWGELQNKCLMSNKHRYLASEERSVGHPPEQRTTVDSLGPPQEPNPVSDAPRYHPRTALLLRAWSNYTYTDNDMQSIRALVTELNLHSGGEYQVFLLVHVKNATSGIWSDGQVYQRVLEANVPAEFQDISILFDESIMQQWYPEIGNWDIYWHQFMPLQWFSKQYPEFDYVWNWEADARYTGNHYHLLEQIARFGKNVPRKYLWERNSRFHFPAAHGTYEEWLNDTDVAIEEAVRSGSLNVVWGAQPYRPSFQQPIGPTPPRLVEEDNFEWGVGEEADLITLQPIWDPTHTMWTYRDKIFNYIPGIRPHFTQEDKLDENFHHPDFVNIPRRTYINTVSRFSKRQLHAMHIENSAGRTMQAEMWPATVALQHGLKAVYAPHPIWADRRWPAWYMDAIFNADGNETARWGTRADSVYNHDREHNFAGWSWYYDSKFARVLYRRWLGWSATVGSEEQYPNNPLRVLGGRQYENAGTSLDGSAFGGPGVRVGGKGRMCLPPMLLHPLKEVYEEADEPDRLCEGFMGCVKAVFQL